MNNTVIKSIEAITGKNKFSSKTPLNRKLKALGKHINPSKYEILGFVDRSNDVVLRPRYYNVRNTLGQFAAIAS
jgi:hypothetical protein